ncbi:MAG: tRNA (adenosine(37)-N6)-threonylcarbamoyltransferase complex dimerization subunit type 1 TsaB [Elainellaceae cyanobacterium]
MSDLSPRYALALHTTTPELGIAIAPLGNTDPHLSLPEATRMQVWDLGHGLSTQLHIRLQTFIQPLNWSDIALIAVARGPGGFTGTRVGVVAARTLAQQLDIPVFPLSSLGAVAWQTILDASATPDRLDIGVEMPARRGQVFAAVYGQQQDGPRIQLVPKLPDTVMAQADWDEVKRNWPDPIQAVSAAGNLGATVTSVLALAIAQWYRGDRPHWSEALPFYGQSPV